MKWNLSTASQDAEVDDPTQFEIQSQPHQPLDIRNESWPSQFISKVNEN